MTDPTERERTALHEAGHHVVAAVCGWRLGAVTIEGGTAADGCSMTVPPLVAVPADADFDAPFVRWPAEVRRRIEAEALVLLAGDVAELLFARRAGRVPEPVSVAAAEIAAEITVADDRPSPPPELPELPAATAAEHAAVTAACDDPAMVADAEKIACLAVWAHWGDAPAAGAWVAYLETQCRALLLPRERRVRRLADVLLAAGTLGAEAVGRVLDAGR